MHDPTSSTNVVVVPPILFTPQEEFAFAGFLTGCSGLTYEAYALDPRQYVTWCAEHLVVLFGARRSDIESVGRRLESTTR